MSKQQRWVNSMSTETLQCFPPSRLQTILLCKSKNTNKHKNTQTKTKMIMSENFDLLLIWYEYSEAVMQVLICSLVIFLLNMICHVTWSVCTDHVTAYLSILVTWPLKQPQGRPFCSCPDEAHDGWKVWTCFFFVFFLQLTWFNSHKKLQAFNLPPSWCASFNLSKLFGSPDWRAPERHYSPHSGSAPSLWLFDTPVDVSGNQAAQPRRKGQQKVRKRREEKRFPVWINIHTSVC